MGNRRGPCSFVSSVKRWRRPALRGRVIIGALAVAVVLGAPLAARAQQASDLPVEGLTVIGYGKSSAPAESAEIQLLATYQDYGPPRAPDRNSVPGEAEREAVAPMVEALVAAGVPEEDIEIVVSAAIGVFYGPGGPGVARVDIQLDDPTQEWISELIDAGIIGAAEENLVLGQIGVAYAVADCAPLEREAREIAFADAETRADLQAEVMGVERGGVVASSDLPVAADALNAYYGLYVPSQLPCSPPGPAPTTGAPVSAPPFDPTDQAEVNVFVQVAVTFALEDGSSEATPTA